MGRATSRDAPGVNWGPTSDPYKLSKKRQPSAWTAGRWGARPGQSETQRQGAVWEAGKPGRRMERRNLETSEPEDCLVPWSPCTDGKTKMQGGEELARPHAPFPQTGPE